MYLTRTSKCVRKENDSCKKIDESTGVETSTLSEIDPAVRKSVKT